MKKILKLILPAILVLTLAGCGNSNPAAKAVEIPTKADYNLIPVYTLDERNVYLNASVTPLEFFAVDCPVCQKDLPEIQNTLNEIKPQKPLVYVATFFKTSDIKEAIKQTKDFIDKYKIQGTVVIQTGTPTAYVKNIPSLVTLDKSNNKPNIVEGKPSKDQLIQVLTNKPDSKPAAEAKK